jgi:hypothetical protein
MTNSCAAIVSQAGDPLSDALVGQLSAQGIPAIQITTESLGDLHTCLDEEVFLLDGQEVGAIFFHAHPDEIFSCSFQENDRPFVDVEIRAIWLAAMQLDSILAINCYDADAWFENLHWTVWRRKFADADVPLAEINYGGFNGQNEDYWLPYTFQNPQQPLDNPTRKLLGAASIYDGCWDLHRFVCSETLTTSPTSSVQIAAKVLLATGIRLVDIWVNSREQVVIADTVPLFSEPLEILAVSERLTELIDARLHYR